MSNKTVYYKQCVLIKKIPTGELKTNSWIPIQFAKVGWTLELKQNDGSWVDGWDVVSASGEPLAGKFVENQAHNSHNIWEPSALITTRGNK